LLGEKFPGIGRGYLAASPFIASRNKHEKIQMLVAYELGVDVDLMIDVNYEKTRIQDYLKTIISI